jgi:hypothetical protein
VRLGIGIYRFEDRAELEGKADRSSVQVPTRSQGKLTTNSLRRGLRRQKRARMP